MRASPADVDAEAEPDAGRRPAEGRPTVPFPVVLACLVVVAVNALVATNQLLLPMPATPWEAGIAAQGWRCAHGEPTYGDIDKDAFAGHMYGPLCTWLLGAVYSVVGFGNPASRVPSLVGSIALTIAVGKLCRVRGPLPWLGAIALIWGINYRVSNIFAESRPDALAFALAVVGLGGLCAGYLRGRAGPYLAGLAAVLAGFLFKQTAAVAAPVFLAALLIDGRRPFVRRVVVGALPLLCVVAAIAGMKVFFPAAYEAIVRVPSQYRVDRREFARVAWHTLYLQPLFWVALLDWLLRGRARLPLSFRLRTIAAAIVVTYPTSVMATTKFGGGDNSMLPFQVATSAFVLYRFPALLGLLRRMRPGWRRGAAGSALGALLILTTFPNPGRHAHFFLPDAARARAYREAVGWLASREGPAVSPEDPTILILARGQSCRNIYLERDARPEGGVWREELPGPVRAEIAAARHLISVESFPTISGDVIPGPALEALGFLRAASNPYYSLWTRK